MRKRVKALLIVPLVLTLTLASTGSSEDYLPNSGHLKGFIYKSDEKTPFWGAQILLQDVKTKEVFRSNVTDSTGDYRLLNVPAGDYLVFIMARTKMYRLKKVDFLIKIMTKKTTYLSFSLEKPILAGFFLFQPCCLAKIIAAVSIPPLFKEKEASPTKR